ncbi:glycoside hydrolase [Gloeophyllum trabeum ATCC 11539]|uniref:Glycoside hydrolase n=1 Tax=Gloeophyllum trabeum (strain ATCC 11539 / FP-39264 / Madison 617) TaxID=670483 RepID=S7RXU0_GLOTA|nr:glycoside hydrolase [Gloeophyllum trabeum ATCC 11539]EPQ58194.1 glycoside hydrolase [Gloeophyllum trabeum ATCC 11539]
MVFSQIGFTSLLRSLGLAQGLLKPAPGALDPNAPQQSLSTQATTLPQTSLNAFAATLHDSPASVEVLDSGDCYVQNYTGPSLIDSYSPFDPVKATIYRYRQQQSVNLGSWFVHEQWMTPSTFKCSSGKQLSEHDIASGWGSTTAARAVLERHWDSFISQEDFYYLASIGINTVRIPIGYWSLGPTYCRDTAFADVAEVYANSWSRVKHAIIMADQAGLGVLVDLHGAPGSQNGQPHSGISDGQTTLFADPSNVEKTMQILTFLAGELSEVTNVVGVQILNEPKNVDSLEDFCGIRNVSSAAEALPLYIHDGFDLTRFSRYVGNRSDFVVQDHHSYFVYTSADENETASDHATDVRSTVLNDLDYASRTGHRNLVVDEWSCALAPQSLAEESDKGGAQQRFCTDQSIAYSSAVAGWGFWGEIPIDRLFRVCLRIVFALQLT